MDDIAANPGEWTSRQTARTAIPLYLILILAALLAYATGVHGRSSLSPAASARSAASHTPAGCEEGIFAATAWACLSAGLESGNVGIGAGRP